MPRTDVGQRLFLVSWWQWSLGAYLADVYASGRPRWWTGLILRRGLWALWGAASLAIGCVDPAIHRCHYTFWLLPVLCFLLVGSLIVRAEQFPKLPAGSGLGMLENSQCAMAYDRRSDGRGDDPDGGLDNGRHADLQRDGNLADRR
ncbi:MAG: hypothetical protein IVW56_07275 [Candidatus Binataceae bacterium]|nr:hypothetical protein [Candidatus Binataceae bacterium]